SRFEYRKYKATFHAHTPAGASLRPARAVGHGQDGWLVTGSLLGLLGGGKGGSALSWGSLAPVGPNAKSVSERLGQMSHRVRPNAATVSHILVSQALVLQEVARPRHGYNIWQTSHHLRSNTLTVP